MAIIDQLSTPFGEALALNSYREQFVELDLTDIEPGTNVANNPFDIGVANLGYDGGQAGVTVQQILVLPFAQGEPGGEFWMRVYGWRMMGNAAPNWLWTPTLLAEVSCRLCSRPGVGVPGIGNGPRTIGANEYVCDTIGLTAGIASIVAPGRNMVAWFVVPTLGCQKVQFDFMIGEELPAFPNALWARA